MRRLSFLLSCICLTACNTQENQSFGYYEEAINPITSFQLGTADDSQIFPSHEGKPLVLTHLGSNLLITDISTDSVIRTIVLPYAVSKYVAMSVVDTDKFALLCDSSFYVYNSGVFRQYPLASFHDPYLPLGNCQMIYMPEQNKIFATVLTQDKKEWKSEKSWSNKFVNAYDLTSNTSARVDLYYPEKYWDNRLGIPKSLLSSVGDSIIISHSYDEYVYILDTRSSTTSKHKLISSISKLDAIYPTGAPKQVRLDALLENQLYHDSYGRAFFDPKQNKFYRIYTPALPKPVDGVYYTSKNRGAWLIEKSDNSKKEYILPNGIFFVPNDWNAIFTNSPQFYYNAYSENRNNSKLFDYISICIEAL